MQAKFTVVALLVILEFSSPVLTLTSCCQRSKNLLYGLPELEANRLETISGRKDALNALFDSLEKLVIKYAYNLKPTNPEDDADAINAGALRRYKEGIDYVLDSISIALRKCCDDIDTTRRVIYAYLKDGIRVVAPVMALVRCRNYSENQAAIDAHKARVQNDAAGVVREIYKLIRACQRITDADALGAIETAEKGSATSIRRAVNAFFNSIEHINFAISYGNTSQELLYDVEDCRTQTLAGSRDRVNHEYALFEALYINSGSNRTGFLSDLVAIQKANIARVDLSEKSIIFNEMLHQANRIRFGIFVDCEQVQHRIDVFQVNVAAAIVSAFTQFLDSIAESHPGDSCAIADARKAIPNHAKLLAAGYITMVKAALDPGKTWSRIITDINSNKNKAILTQVTLIQISVAIIHKNQTCNTENENKFGAIIDRAVKEVTNYALSLRDGAVILAKMAHGKGKFCIDHILAIQDAQRSGDLAITNYMNAMSEAVRFSLLTGEQSSHGPQMSPNSS